MVFDFKGGWCGVLREAAGSDAHWPMGYTSHPEYSYFWNSHFTRQISGGTCISAIKLSRLPIIG